jgi:hypothetical protein
MKWDVYILKDTLEQMLTNAGFIPELYQIKVEVDCVFIYFDKKAAVEYFEKEFDESGLIKDCVFEYKRFGKKHAACIYYW